MLARHGWSLLALLCLGSACAASGPMDGWRFRFRDYPIAAWWGPEATDADIRVYAEAGFNIAMTGRYMELADGYGNPDALRDEMDLCARHGLSVMIDTYTRNDAPWGGEAGPYEPHPIHHPASLIELQWLHARYGEHPALVGYMIGDDQGAIGERSQACTEFLRGSAPELYPWLCGWISADNLAANHNPIANPQIYPTLYSWGQSAEGHMRSYASAYNGWRQACRAKGVLFWPMFNTSSGEPDPDPDRGLGWCPSDSLVRFPAYSALAYGAQGIWYFTYGGGAIARAGKHETLAEAHAALTPLYPVVRKANAEIARWGRKILGAECVGLFGTAFAMKDDLTPFGSADSADTGEGLAHVGLGKLVRAMDEDLMVGILTKPGQAPLAMVVNCQAGKGWADVPSRTVSVEFDSSVTGVRVWSGASPRRVRGPRASFTLEPGAGMLLELEGRGPLPGLCTESAIYAPTDERSAELAKPGSGGLARATAAKLRIDVSGSDGGEFAAKWIELNGERIARVPEGSGDRWVTRVIALSPEQVRLLAEHNEVVVRTESGDAWKFRNLCLAARLPDGRWAVSGTDARIHSVAGWAYSEGELWGKDGVAGPVVLAF